MKRSLLLACVAMIPIACSSPTAPKKAIQITSVSWYYENNPSDHSSGHLDLGLTVHYSGSSIQANDITSLDITSQTSHWQLTANSSSLIVNDSAKTITANLFSDRLSSNGTVLPIDSFYFKATLTSGTTTSMALSASAPGMTTANGYKFCYTQDYSGSIPATFVQTIRRPTIDSCYLANGSIVINFKINDPLFNNGWLWFYNSSGTYIGVTTVFRISATKALSSIINSGSALYSDSLHENVANVGTQNCTINPPYAFSDIYSARVITTDGVQFQSDPSRSYSYRSVSPMVTVSSSALTKKTNGGAPAGTTTGEEMPDDNSL